MLTIAMLAMNEITSEQRKREQFQNDVETVVTYLRAARSDAISNRQLGALNETREDAGFGIYIDYDQSGDQDTLQLIRYLDNKDDVSSDVADQQLSFSSGNPVDHIIEQKTLNAPWVFSIENPLPATITPANEINTLFLPPNSDMVINTNDAAEDLRSVELVFEYQDRKRRICLNRVSRFIEIISGETCP
jgi:hypothetical protein